MDLPPIDFSALPDLDTLTSIFGSIFNTGNAGGSDDSFIDIAAFVYERTIRP